MTGDALARLQAALEGRYRIERHLGEGGMALVYLAEDLKHHRQVALKVLRPEWPPCLGGERFLKEIEVTANLQHPNILPLYDSGEADTFLYYVMPLMEGETLREKLDRERQLPVDETVEIARSGAAALDYAHRHGVVHRDIKPANILLHDGQALVSDFGIALAMRSAGGETRLTETGLSIGTPHYMSPEQAAGDRELGRPLRPLLPGRGHVRDAGGGAPPRGQIGSGRGGEDPLRDPHPHPPHPGAHPRQRGGGGGQGPGPEPRRPIHLRGGLRCGPHQPGLLRWWGWRVRPAKPLRPRDASSDWRPPWWRPRWWRWPWRRGGGCDPRRCPPLPGIPWPSNPARSWWTSSRPRSRWPTEGRRWYTWVPGDGGPNRL